MKSRKKKSRRARRRGGTDLEWVGGLLELPFFVTDREEPYRPAVALWMELPDGFLVGQKIVAPEAVEGVVGRTLLAAMAEPGIGPPRRPARIRVADAALVGEVRESVGEDVPIEVAPTPELTELVEMMVEDLGAAGSDEEREPPSYLEGGRIAEPVVAGLFKAAELLFTMKPWEVAADSQILRLDIPALGVEGACLSIIGVLGESLGLLIFPSLEGYEAFLEVAEGAFPEGPLPDLGSGWLALNFERGADVPASMRREVAKHGWPVAGADAFPLVERRERDGVLRPLVERDLDIVTACATSFCAFFGQHRELFGLEKFEPVCQSFFDENDREVRFTLPYEAYPWFEVETPPWIESAAPAGSVTPSAPAGSPERPKVGRNDPCPCGSGRKYKKCHLPLDREEESLRRRCEAVHDLDGALVYRLMQFARGRFGAAARGFEKYFENARSAAPLSAPWSVYQYEIEEGTVLEHFLEGPGRRLPEPERDWLEAQRAAWLSVWEVTEVHPGKTVTVRDLLSGEERCVQEAGASQTLVPRDALLARIVDHQGLSLFCGMHPNPLPPFDAAEVVRRARGRLRRKTAVPVERLRPAVFGGYLIRRWEEALADLAARPRVPSELHNTDGDPLLLTTDHFDFAPADRSAVEAGLAALDGARREEGSRGDVAYVFLRPGKKKSGRLEATVIGHARVGKGALRLETNSRERADALRSRVEETLGSLLRHRAREHTDPLSAGLPRPDPDRKPEPPTPEQEQLALEFKRIHYADWPDEPLPALDGKTPRQAVRTAAGRSAVDLLLKDMENFEQRSAGAAAFDFSGIRRELRLE